MLNVNAFKAVAELAVGARARRTAEHMEFLSFYRNLVETVPTEAAAIFGNYQVKVVKNGKVVDGWGILLTPTDYIFWKTNIEREGVRFVESPSAVQIGMLGKFAQVAEQQRLSPEERSRLLAVLEGGMRT